MLVVPLDGCVHSCHGHGGVADHSKQETYASRPWLTYSNVALRCDRKGERQMKALWLFVLAAGLALVPSAADAAHYRHKTAAEHAPRVLPRGPSQQNDSYYVPYVTNAAGRRVPIMQIPSSVTVIPQQLMQDQQDITMCEALRNISGVFCR